MTERVLTKKEKRQQKERQIMDDTLAAQTQQRWDASAARKNNEKLILDVIDGEGRILRNDSWDTTRVPASVTDVPELGTFDESIYLERLLVDE